LDRVIASAAARAACCLSCLGAHAAVLNRLRYLGRNYPIMALSGEGRRHVSAGSQLTGSKLFKRQLPLFLLSFVLAELFYKFKSFALECAAFLVTWYILDWILNGLLQLRSARTRNNHPSRTTSV
jgi:hypothetical protein